MNGTLAEMHCTIRIKCTVRNSIDIGHIIMTAFILSLSVFCIFGDNKFYRVFPAFVHDICTFWQIAANQKFRTNIASKCHDGQNSSNGCHNHKQFQKACTNPSTKFFHLFSPLIMRNKTSL